MGYESCLNHDGGLVSTVTPQPLLLIPHFRKITSPSSHNEEEHFRHLTNIYGPRDVSSQCLSEMCRQLHFIARSQPQAYRELAAPSIGHRTQPPIAGAIRALISMHPSKQLISIVFPLLFLLPNCFRPHP